MNIRKATQQDLDAVAELYGKVHTAEEAGKTTTGWQRAVYPTRQTAQLALQRGDLFLLEDNGVPIGTAILNQQQPDAYREGSWAHPAPDDRVMVIHTLAIDPDQQGKGYGRQFIAFYEQYARENGCPFLRLDTNARNTAARAFYRALGYTEVGIVPCEFNGLPDVSLVLLEKYGG